MKNIFSFLVIFISLNVRGQIPSLDYANTSGSSEGDRTNSIITDGAGNIYAAGYFHDTVDFDPGAGVLNLNGEISQATFIVKYNSSGSVAWAKEFLHSYPYSITIDSSASIYVTGSFIDSSDFDPGNGVHILHSSGSRDIFILKLDSSGNFIWANSIGGSVDDNGFSICMSNSNSICVAGEFGDTVDFDPGSGITDLISSANPDGYVARYDLSGNLIWAKSFSGTGFNNNVSVTTDNLGNIISIGGFVGTTDFDPGATTFNITSGPWDMFISKLNSNGNFIWAKQFAGNDFSNVNHVVIDQSNNIYVTGSFDGTFDFDPDAGVANLISNGGDDLYLCKLNSNGNFIWVKQIGSANQQSGTSMVIDHSNRICLTGYFYGICDFDTGAGTDSLTTNGGFDFFLSMLDLNGNTLYSFNIGGIGYDEAWSITCDNSDNVFLGGHFGGTVDFDATTSSDIHSSNGNEDFFVLKFNPSAASISEIKSSDNLLIYPNPATNQLTVESVGSQQHAVSRIEITDALGRKLFSIAKPLPTSTIQLQTFSAGIYFIKVYFGDGEMEVKKFMKE